MFGHALQAEAGGLSCRGEAAAAIADLQQPFVAELENDLNTRRMTVLHRVGNCLTSDVDKRSDGHPIGLRVERLKMAAL